MTCTNTETTYYCNCIDFTTTEYDSLEDHIVSHANNGNGEDHYYLGYCCGDSCTILHEN